MSYNTHSEINAHWLQIFICDVCNKEFNNDTLLKCDVCDKEFNNLCDLQCTYKDTH